MDAVKKFFDATKQGVDKKVDAVTKDTKDKVELEATKPKPNPIPNPKPKPIYIYVEVKVEAEAKKSRDKMEGGVNDAWEKVLKNSKWREKIQNGGRSYSI
jgi:hypothetical protein